MTHRGAVAAGDAATTAAAVTILLEGGNAFDAAVGAGFAASVAEPHLTSLAGGGFLMARGTGRGAPRVETVFDFFVATPGLEAHVRHDPASLVAVPIRFGHAVQDFHVGAASVGVPGVLAGYLAVHEALGRLPLAAVVDPAIHLARLGVVVDPFLAQLSTLLTPILERSEEGRLIFFDGERPLAVGDTLTNPHLGSFLADIAAGERTGFRADELGGSVTVSDLSAYRVVEREPLRVDHGGVRVLTNPSPSMGGTLVAHALEQFGDPPPVTDRDDPQHVRRLAAALRSMTERRASLGPGASRGTTHISVVDSFGNTATMTTSNGSGSGEFAPGLGVQLNNVMGEADLHPGGFGAGRPGERVGSMMTPTILELPDGTVAAIGSGGSERIRSTVAGLVIDLVDVGLTMDHAVHAPRLHWDGHVFQAEPGRATAALVALRDDGADVNVWSRRDLYFGGAHCVLVPPNDERRVEAVGDPRRGGVGSIVDG